MKRRKFDHRAAAMRTMTIAEAMQSTPVVCDGDDWLMSHDGLNHLQEQADVPDEECIGYDEDGDPIFAPTDELYPELA